MVILGTEFNFELIHLIFTVTASFFCFFFFKLMLLKICFLGPLVSTTGLHLTAFLSNNEENASKDIIDHQLYFLEINSLFIKTNFQYRPEVRQLSTMPKNIPCRLFQYKFLRKMYSLIFMFEVLVKG